MTPYYDDGRGIVIYNADCREILPSLPKVDLVLTDPPYGIAYNAQNQNTPNASVYLDIAGDNDTELVRWLFSHLESADNLCVFGANCFPELLPHRGRWLVWDKRDSESADKMLGSPVELAWTSRTSGFDWICRLQHGGVVNADKGKRHHPTQKPVGLMRFVLRKYPTQNIILDPFMGSGTTLRAAKDLGRKAIGIEIEEKYCEIAARRLQQEVLSL